MDGQRQRSGGRGRRHKRGRPTSTAEPILIAARRPNAPRLDGGRGRSVAASARPRSEPSAEVEVRTSLATPPAEPAPRRTARIIALSKTHDNEQERLRSKLLDRLVSSEGHSAVTRAAREFREAGFEYPVEQRVQLQLLEHLEEATVREALFALSELVEREPVLKSPVLDQRLRRLEEHADEGATRLAAAALRRLVRASTSVARDR
jgi:hypothetical protein